MAETMVIPKRGDWVRFYQNGQLVIGQVEYLTEERGWWHAITDNGSVRSDHIYEIRSPADPEAPNA